MFLHGDEVLRGLTEEGRTDFEVIAARDFFDAALASGRVIGTRPAARSLPGFAASLLHDRLPAITYPYEWSFSMLRDAALLTLELTAAALDDDVAVKDATPYNVQFRGANPVFIDVGSFEPLQDGEPWYGYLQFCQLFLYPLLLQAHKDLDVRPWLRGALDGISPADAARLFSCLDWRRRGVLKHVVLHARVQRAYAEATTSHVRKDVARAGFRKEITAANLRGLQKLVRRLRWDPAASEWSGYRDDNTYSAADTQLKSDVVAAVCAAARPAVVWDLGANDGHYSRIAAQVADTVLAVDADPVTVEHLYRALRAEGSTRILPLVADLADPSPSLGWRGAERRDLLSRSRPDVVLALAVVHHLALSRNLPIPEIVAWLADLGAEVVLEVPHADDPQVQRLLRNKRAGLFRDYGLPAFQHAVGTRFVVQSSHPLPSGTRTLLHLVPK